MIDEFSYLTKISQKESASLIRWFGRQNVEFQTRVMKEQSNQFAKLRASSAKKELIALASLYLAIKHLKDEKELLRRKNVQIPLSKIEKITNNEMIRFKIESSKPKEQRLFDVIDTIKRLHKEGCSSRTVRKLLQIKHRIDVSHTTISSFINKHIKVSTNG